MPRITESTAVVRSIYEGIGYCNKVQTQYPGELLLQQPLYDLWISIGSIEQRLPRSIEANYEVLKLAYLVHSQRRIS
jgi:hypothetical protein